MKPNTVTCSGDWDMDNAGVGGGIIPLPRVVSVLLNTSSLNRDACPPHNTQAEIQLHPIASPHSRRNLRTPRGSSPRFSTWLEGHTKAIQSHSGAQAEATEEHVPCTHSQR